MNQIERRIQITIAQRTIVSLNRQLFYLQKDRERLLDILLDKKSDPDVRAGVQLDLDKLMPRLDAITDRRLQQHMLIDELDAQAAKEAAVRVISESGSRAQIVVTYTLDNGKKQSYTRHVRREGAQFVGFSTLTGSKVAYSLGGG